MRRKFRRNAAQLNWLILRGKMYPHKKKEMEYLLREKLLENGSEGQMA
ncbi:hypothetical protein J7J90_02925 [Candidatus Micrarchaeota archaeon]|nr:hypothetical protein [Candidatus Micrarchaeota archaeon]